MTQKFNLENYLNFECSCPQTRNSGNSVLMCISLEACLLNTFKLLQQDCKILFVTEYR
jgi:hypothetical protein